MEIFWFWTVLGSEKQTQFKANQSQLTSFGRIPEVECQSSDVCLRPSFLRLLVSVGKIPANWLDYGKFEQKKVASFRRFGYNT